MNTGIYKILNKVDGKFYLGSAVNIKSRWARHKRDLNKNIHQNILLQRAWNKYWGQSFEFIILEYCKKEILIAREQFWLDWTNCAKPEVGYNLTPTAGNSLGVKHSEETRKRMSEAKKKMTDETKEKMRLARKGIKHTEEHKKKISLGGMGRIHSEETRTKIGNAHKGRKISEETRKNRLTKRGKYKTKADKVFEAMSASPIGY